MSSDLNSSDLNATLTDNAYTFTALTDGDNITIKVAFELFPSENPLLISPVIRSRHWIGSNWENWGIDFWVNVADPQGLGSVESVWAEGADGIRYELHDDGEHNDDLANDGNFANWIGGMSEPPILGIYTFKAEDDTGNIVSATDTLTAVLDSPGNVTPANDTIVSEPNFIFNWDAVPGATWYEVQFVNMNWDHTYWSSGRGLTQTSVHYNEDGTGEALTDGGVYKFTVRAGDGKNESENIVDRIAYRTDGQKGTIHVDVSNTSGMEDGSSAHPFNTIQEGMNASISGDTILVKPGTYVENINFNGKNITVQSTDGAESTTIDGNQNGTVVGFWSGEDSTAILKGFTVRNGLRQGNGGGIDCANSAPSLLNLIIRDNAAHDGGGINCYRSSPIMNNLVISGNSAAWSAGGVNCAENSSPDILNVTITGNSARFGGGINVWNNSDPILRNVRVLRNTAYDNGGGVNIDSNSSPTMLNVTIAGNLSHGSGGGVSCFNASELNLKNVTISDNSSEYGGGIYSSESNLTMTNSISWSNTPQEILFESWNIPSSISIEYSDIRGGETGIIAEGNGTTGWSEGNMNVHPAFVNPSVADYRLQSVSPCIDAGNPAAEYNDKDGTRNDMGAYGGPGGESYAYEDGPPSVENVMLNPGVSYPGNSMIIAAEVRDAVSSVSSVRAEMKKSDGTWVASISLYDDGLHNDGTAGDGIYGNSWETPSGEYEYHVDITASDNQGHNVTYNNAGKFSTQVIYDDFETEPIDLAKWEEFEQVREISDGKLRLNLQGADSTMSWRIHLQEADTLYLEAKVLVESSSYVSSGATAITRIGGWFYNDSRGEGSGQEHNGYEGDVWADNRIILDENNKLIAKTFLWRTNNADDTSDAELFGQEFSTPVNFDTEYTLSIEFTGTAFVFKCNENVLSYQLTTPAYPPSENDIQLTSRIYADSGEFGYIKATFDDVCITKGGAPYDNFEADTIDLSKWAESEYVREISEGKLRLNIRGYEQKSTTDVYLTNGDTFYYEGKVFFESDSHVSPETPGVVGLSGWFYNDSRGPGSGQNYNRCEGDIWLDIRIILDENRNLTAKASATRADDADNSSETVIFEQDFSGSINFDTEYLLSIEVSDSEIIFKYNDESLNYPLTTPVYKPYRNNKRLMSRIYADPGESGYVKAWFDDVSVTKRPTPPPLADAGQDQKIDEGKTVILDASHSSHPDGTIASYQWNQIEGPSVTLSEPSDASPTFAAPEVDSNEVALIFRVTVIDEEGLQNTDACVIYLTDVVFDDSDEDGMADNWEMGYFGALDKDDAGDFDGDGISDLDEYLNGTDPLIRTPGDINQDRQIDLTDAILALKIISGIDPDTVVRKVADINGDGKIGTEEAIYALQIAGGMEISTNEVSGHVSEGTTWSGDIMVTGYHT